MLIMPRLLGAAAMLMFIDAAMLAAAIAFSFRFRLLIFMAMPCAIML